ncbi:hypothetical protein HMPREF1168_02211 [Aeromonas veronii AMC34]|uniref:Uncharacterized protein n=1 Tax=Aeromonas veronii AMC34 TaxID=1073383 RepID=K1J208_AERVE|nr:hypothetical protein HMPREF1168_02211 [Aeromonas veronii AMC34]
MLHLMGGFKQNVTGITSFPLDSTPYLAKVEAKRAKNG